MLFPEVEDEDGETVRITHGRFIALLESANREVRENTFKKYYSTYKQFLNTYASLYNGQVKQQIFYAKARKYESTLVASVDENNVSPVDIRLCCGSLLMRELMGQFSHLLSTSILLLIELISYS